ncbi:hypothetical protein M0R45_010302 [Rubus argutus]|uniref:Disease resistance N-terminal domain-containing protein n=1 Tax=Rubus argutus TaxID=59490 RepID=A0AAW1Y6P3_RUBAR
MAEAFVSFLVEQLEMKQVKQATVRRWLSNLKEILCEIDDVLDEWSTEILKQQIEKQENEGENAILAKKKKVCFSIPFHCLCFGQVNQIIHRLDIAKKITELNEKLSLINEQRKFYNFQALEKAIEQPERLKNISIVDKSGTFGRDYEKGRRSKPIVE